MRILGIDPGTIVIGYGVIDSQQDEVELVTFSAITCKARSPLGERLLLLYEELMKVIRKYQPDVMAIETPFVSQNVKTALAIGKAQAIALLAAAQNDIPIFEYSPAQIKQHVADYGASTKEQIQEMVRLQLNLDAVPEPNDAADALAVAICHLREARLKDIIAESE